MRFIDCNVLAGERHRPDPWRADTIDALLAAMERCDLAEAHVTHMRSLEYDAMSGNERLIGEIDGHPNLHPVWVITPSAPGDMPGPAALLPMMRDAGVRMLRACPNRHNYSLAEWNFADWYEALAAHRVPLLLDFNEIGNWSVLHDALTRHPGLRVIVTNPFYRQERNLAALMHALPNLYLETSTYKVNFGLERLAARYGSGRLLFGSNMLDFAPGPALAAVLRLDLPEPDRAAIAHGNLERLLAEVSL